MNKLLKTVSILLAFLFISVDSLAQPANREITTMADGKLFGPAGSLKDRNPVFYLDPESIPPDITLEYVESVFISALEEFNNIEGVDLNMTYGGLRPGLCSEPLKDYPEVWPSQHVLIDPDTNLLCFRDDLPTGGIGDVTITYDEFGMKHESIVNIIRSWDPDNNAPTSWLDDSYWLKENLLHEFGHSVGLNHVRQERITAQGFEGGSVECIDICVMKTGKLHPYDIAQLQFLYSTKPEKNPRYPIHCMRNIMDRSQHGGAWGETWLYYVTYQDDAYRLASNLNPQKLRFEIWSSEELPLSSNGDCVGLEFVDDELFLPYISLEHRVFELLLKRTEDEGGIYLNIIDGCRLYPEPKKPCSIDP